MWEHWGVEILAFPLTWHIAYTTACGYRTSRDILRILCYLNNYRAIAISNSATKMIEVVLVVIIETVDNADLYQFGLSTCLCTNVLKSTVNYYRQQGSHVFCSFIDFSKAFDTIDYWLLFYKMWIVLQRLFTVLQLGCFASGITN